MGADDHIQALRLPHRPRVDCRIDFVVDAERIGRNRLERTARSFLAEARMALLLQPALVLGRAVVATRGQPAVGRAHDPVPIVRARRGPVGISRLGQQRRRRQPRPEIAVLVMAQLRRAARQSRLSSLLPALLSAAAAVLCASGLGSLGVRDKNRASPVISMGVYRMLSCISGLLKALRTLRRVAKTLSGRALRSARRPAGATVSS